VVSDQAPFDICSATSPRAAERIEPVGVSSSALNAASRELLLRLVTLYLGRMPADLGGREMMRVGRSEFHFAWQGPAAPGTRHYYRVQADDLLIEYDSTTEGGNHAHTVLRRPRSDFGDDVLAAHLSQDHGAA
jgi:hypothetical protein